MLRIARTIAGLDGAAAIMTAHLTEAGPGGGGEQAAVADLVRAAVEVVVVRVLRAQHRDLAVDVAALHRATHHEVVPAPAMVGAVAIARERASEVAGRERRDLALRAHGTECGVEVAHRVRQARHQVGVGAVLVVVHVETAEADEEHLALGADASCAARIDHPRDHLQLLREAAERLPAGQRVVVLQLRVGAGVVGAACRRRAEQRIARRPQRGSQRRLGVNRARGDRREIGLEDVAATRRGDRDALAQLVVAADRVRQNAWVVSSWARLTVALARMRLSFPMI